MARPCEACRHPDREQLDAALVAGAPFRTIAGRYGITHPSVIRHRNGHLAEQVQAAVETRRAEQDAPEPPATAPPAEPLDVLAQLRAVNAATLRVLQDARTSGDGRLVLLAVDRVLKQCELSARLLGELDDRPQINLLVAPEWLLVRSTLIRTLAPYPGGQNGRCECPYAAGGSGMTSSPNAPVSRVVSRLLSQRPISTPTGRLMASQASTTTTVRIIFDLSRADEISIRARDGRPGEREAGR